ncbi:MAG: SDR family NAD(P)-dependent oxidoreductase, partial [Streptosporangiaceae bacterium]
ERSRRPDHNDQQQHTGQGRQMIEVNPLGAITTTEVFLDQLKYGGGDIINISSVAGLSQGVALTASEALVSGEIE